MRESEQNVLKQAIRKVAHADDFEFSFSTNSHPKLEGVVVCAEFETTLLQVGSCFSVLSLNSYQGESIESERKHFDCDND